MSVFADAKCHQARGKLRRIDVQANVKGRDLGAVGDVQVRLEKMAFPLGYYAVLQGEYQELSAGADAELFSCWLAVILVASATVVQQLRLAVLSFLTCFALVGGVLAAWLAAA